MPNRTRRSDQAAAGPSRREVLAGAGALAGVGLEAMLLSACTPGASTRPGRPTIQAAGTHGAVRLLSVPTVRDGGEWSGLGNAAGGRRTNSAPNTCADDENKIG